MQQNLLTHAIRNVWCSPDQDKQLILNLKRITRVGGVRGEFTIHWQNYTLPTPRERYHVYPIGQNSVERFNLPTKRMVWNNLMDLANSRNLLADIYTVDGHVFNRSKAWIMITRDGNIVLAVQDQDRTTEISSGRLYMRLHTNAYFSSERSASLDVDVRVEGIRVEIKNEQLALQGRYQSYQSKVGYTTLFHNGNLVDTVRPTDVELGDFIEYVHDSSITEVVNLKIGELQTYRSSLDQNRKYLVHLPKSVNRIDYQDDVDFYLYVRDEYGNKSGRYLHQNHPSICRMVTHRDYGISVDAVAHYINSVEGWTMDNVELLVLVHESGYDRPLVDEHNRIRELYRLDDEGIVNALVGINSIMPEWKAAELESSSYLRIMSAQYQSITPAEVINAYGYNAIAKFAVKGLIPVANNNVDLPAGLIKKATILEYTQFGVLIGFYHSYNSDIYTVKNPSCAYIEGYPGLGGDYPALIKSEGTETLDPEYGYRFYIATRDEDVLKGPWREVTNDFTVYELSDQAITWNMDPVALIGAYACTDTFFIKSYVIGDATEYTYEIDLRAEAAFADAEGMDLGQVIVFLNGRSLTANVDYREIDGHICIFNIDYMKAGSPQDLTVMVLDRPSELINDVGFVLRDRLSLNSVYNVRDDKVVRCVVDGRVKDITKMPLDESKASLGISEVFNGKPYSIRSVPVPVHGIAPFNAYLHIDKSMEVDNRVREFLTQQLPKEEFELPPFIDSKYAIFSPVTAKILSDWANDLVGTPDLAEGEDAIERFMERYEFLLPFDPCRTGIDLNHVDILTHRFDYRVSITSQQYEVLNRIVKLYLNDLVTISYGIIIN